jgi:hypothetical protein
MFHRIFENGRWWDRVDLRYRLKRGVVDGSHLGSGMQMGRPLCVP